MVILRVEQPVQVPPHWRQLPVGAELRVESLTPVLQSYLEAGVISILRSDDVGMETPEDTLETDSEEVAPTRARRRRPLT